MPRIGKQYLNCTIYLYESAESAQEGAKFGGSGCLVSVDSENGSYHPAHIYAVTNKHVAEKCPVVRLNTVDGNIDVLNLRVDDWTPHPDGDDLAVAPIALPDARHDYFAITSFSFLQRKHLGFVAAAGDDTFMVGRFVNHAGIQRNTPSLRFGSIAMLPFEKVKLRNGYLQEAFLVETRSISGYSGSPVFAYEPEYSKNWHRDYPIAVESIKKLVGNPILLGIDCGHILQYKNVIDAQLKPHPHGLKVESNTGMAIVIPAWRLADLLNTKDFVTQRNQKDYELKLEKEAEERVVPDADRPH
jgi:hypothetical protein